MTDRREYEMTEADLSPCPWCDPAASTNLPHLHELPPDRGPCKWQVMCLGCCAAGPTGFTPGDAVKFWNHRRSVIAAWNRRAFLALPDAQQIAATVETYTDILSPETARKVASRIRAIPEQPASPKGWLGRGINDPDSGA